MCVCVFVCRGGGREMWVRERGRRNGREGDRTIGVRETGSERERESYGERERNLLTSSSYRLQTQYTLYHILIHHNTATGTTTTTSNLKT